MERFLAAIAAATILSLPTGAGAETLSFEGTLSDPRAVVRIPITLANPLSGVVIWTDSFNNGARFDPITALWRDGVRLGENDDRSGLMPGQTVFDSGLTFETLAAGSYLLTITSYDNFANGSLLADGFQFDDPMASASPIRNCSGPGDCPGGFWRVHLQDNFIPAVPEPAHALLLAAGTAVLAGVHQRRRGRVKKIF